MNISEVSGVRLSEWIAERLEPVASLPEPSEAAVIDDSYPSPLNCWYSVCLFEEADIPRWQHRDMVNDSAMTVMLMEELIKLGRRLHFSEKGLCVFQGEPWDKTAPLGTDFHGPLGRAVADAFAVANGWPL